MGGIPLGGEGGGVGVRGPGSYIHIYTINNSYWSYLHQLSDSELGHHQVIIPVLELAPVCETVDLSHRDPLEMDMLVQGGA